MSGLIDTDVLLGGRRIENGTLVTLYEGESWLRKCLAMGEGTERPPEWFEAINTALAS